MVALLGAGIATGHCPTTLSTWASYIVTGFRLGAIYAMIALGYTMVYGVLQLLNFAHSEVFMVGSFAGLYTLSKIFHLSSSGPGKTGAAVFLVLAVGLLFAAVGSGITAVVMERLAYRPLRRGGASRLGYLITAIGVSLFLSNLFLLLDGQKHLGLPWTWPNIAGRAPVGYPIWMARKTAFSVFGVG